MAKFTQKEIESGKEFTFESETGDVLDLWHKTDGPNWTNKFQGMFNGEFFSYKTFVSFEKKANDFIDKYELNNLSDDGDN